MIPFAKSSYLAQVRRLRGLAETVLERFPLKGTSLHFINHGENTTFRVESKQGRFLLRIHRHGYHTRAAIAEELQWLHRLDKYPELFTPSPVKSKSGNYLEEISSLAAPELRFCDLLHWVEGKFIFKTANVSHMEQLGLLMARLQKSTDKIKVQHRRYWDSNGLLGPDPKFGSIDSLPGIGKADQKFLTKNKNLVFEKIRVYEKQRPDRLGLIHADLHFGNFVVHKQGIGAIDFDDCGFGFHAYGLAVPLTHLANLDKLGKNQKFYALASALQEGYAKEASWDSRDQEILRYLFVARKILMLGWLNSRSDNPRIGKFLKKAIPKNLKYLHTDWSHKWTL